MPSTNTKVAKTLWIFCLSLVIGDAWGFECRGWGTRRTQATEKRWSGGFGCGFKALGNIYITYIPGIYCLQGDYKIPTTYYQNENNPMSGGAKFGGLFVIFFRTFTIVFAEGYKYIPGWGWASVSNCCRCVEQGLETYVLHYVSIFDTYLRPIYRWFISPTDHQKKSSINQHFRDGWNHNHWVVENIVSCQNVLSSVFLREVHWRGVFRCNCRGFHAVSQRTKQKLP